MKNQFGRKTVLLDPKSIKLNHIKGFNILDFKKHHFKINKTQSQYGLDLFVLCSRGGNFIFFILHLINHRILPLPKKFHPPPFTPKIFFHYHLTFCLFPCYAIYIAKNRVGDRILECINSRVFTNQPTKN